MVNLAQKILLNKDEDNLQTFHVGVRYFFGVTIDDKGMPIHDREQPYEGFLEEWIERSIN